MANKSPTVGRQSAGPSNRAERPPPSRDDSHKHTALPILPSDEKYAGGSSALDADERDAAWLDMFFFEHRNS